MTVWAVHANSDDVSSAQQYGAITYINHRYVYGDEIVDEKLPVDFVRHIQDCVRRFDVERDYVLINGDHLQLMALAAMLGARFPMFRVLRWDRQAKAYMAVQVGLSVST